MMEYMPHSGRKPHIWKFRSSWYRQLLITHGWGLRGGYASKFIGGHEYMMTRIGEEGSHTVCLLRRKEDFWADVSRERRDEGASEARQSFHAVSEFTGRFVANSSPQADTHRLSEGLLVQQGCLPAKTLDEIRADMKREFPGITDNELDALGC